MEETPGRASLEKLGCRTPPQLHAGGVGRQQQQHKRGVGVLLTKQVARSMVGFHALSDRVILISY